MAKKKTKKKGVNSAALVDKAQEAFMKFADPRIRLGDTDRLKRDLTLVHLIRGGADIDLDDADSVKGALKGIDLGYILADPRLERVYDTAVQTARAYERAISNNDMDASADALKHHLQLYEITKATLNSGLAE